MHLDFVKEKELITRLLLKTKIPLSIRLEIKKAYHSFVELRKSPTYAGHNIGKFNTVGTFIFNCVAGGFFKPNRHYEIRKEYGMVIFPDKPYKTLGDL